MKRFKTDYPGVYYILGKSITGRKQERIFYIAYRKNGRLIEEKAGRQFQDDMTPAKASRLKAMRIEGKQLSNKESREKEREIFLKKNIWTLNKIWNEYYYQKSEEGLKGLYIDEYRYEKYFRERFGDREPKDISIKEIDGFRFKHLKNLKPETIRQILSLLQRIVKFGINKQLIQAFHFKIQMPKVNNEKTEDLTSDQLRNLLKSIEADPNIHAANIMKMALFTGMRRGELFKLKWQNIDFQRGFISIIDPKGKVDQKIPLNDQARKLLENHFHEDSEYVFPGRSGKMRVDISNAVNRIKKRAGLPADFRPLHGLRHVYASMLASSGKVDMYTLQKLLTHKSPQMTQRYAHLRDDALKNASELAGNIISEIADKKD